MTKQIKTWQERYHDHPDQEYCMLLEIDELRAELDLLQSDSYEAIWQALQRIETAIVCLPTFEVEVDGGVDACAENIVLAIIKAAALLKSKPALAQTEQPAQGEPVAWLIEYEHRAGGMNRGNSLTKFDYVWHKHSFLSGFKDAKIDSENWRNRKETPLYPAALLQSKPAEPVNQALFDAPEILAKYTGFNGHRQWVKVGAWLHPGDCVAVLSPQRAVQLREGRTQYVEAAQSAKREPLTDEQFNDLVMQHLGPHALTGGKMSVYDAFLLAVRATEAAHGITKGQQ
jgi:hypothetical protein